MATINSWIVMFGNTTSGKTTYLQAIQHMLDTHFSPSRYFHDYYADEKMLPRHHPDLASSREHSDRPGPNESGEPITVVLSREPRTKKVVGPQDISTHMHRIMFWDDKGGIYGQLGGKGTSLERPDARSRPTFDLIGKRGTGIIVLLDATAIRESPNFNPVGSSHASFDLANRDEPDHLETDELGNPLTDELPTEKNKSSDEISNAEEEIGVIMSAAQQAKMVGNLEKLEKYAPLTYITSRRNGKEEESDEVEIEVPRRIAICLAKYDLVVKDEQQAVNHVKADTTEFLLQSRFQPVILGAINKLKAHFGEENVELFLISSTGFDRTGQSNATKTGKLVKEDGEEWKPFNVQEPLFWLLDHFETDVINDMVSKRKIKFGGLTSKHRIPWSPKK